MTDELRRRAREMMNDDAAEAGFRKATPLAAVQTVPGNSLTEEEAKLTLSMTFMSRSDSVRPHIVSVGIDGVAWCTCRASVPCWATKAFCRVTGRPVYP